MSSAPEPLELTADAERLLAVVDSLPIRTRERERLITALGLHSSDAWFRVELRTDPSHLDQLRWAQPWATPHDLARIIDVAEVTARMYGYTAITPGLIAVALAVTTRASEPTVRRLVETTAEAFGLGTLEGAEAIRDQYLRWVEAHSGYDVTAGSLEFGFRGAWYRVFRVLPSVDPLLRICLCVALSIIAAGAPSVVAWFLPFLALVPTRRKDLLDAPGVERLPVGLRVNWYSLSTLAGLAGLFHLWPACSLLLAAHLVLEAVAIIGETIQSRTVSPDGPAFRALDDAAKPLYERASRLVYRFPVHDRAVRFIVPLTIATSAVSWTLPLTSAWGVCALLFFFVADGRFVTTTLFAVAIALVLGWHITTIALFVALGLIAWGITRWRRRIRPLDIPIALRFVRERPLTGIVTQLRARRLIGLRRPSAAVRVIDSWADAVPGDPAACSRSLAPLRTWALLDAGRAAEALDQQQSAASDDNVFSDLVEARARILMGVPEEALAAIAGAVDKLRRGTAAHRGIGRALLLAAAEVDARAGRTLPVLQLIPSSTNGRHLLTTLRLLRLAGLALSDTNPVIADRLLVATAALGLAPHRALSAGTSMERGQVPRWAEIEGTMAAVSSARVVLKERRRISAEDYEQWRVGCEALFRLGNPSDVAAEFEAMADELGTMPQYRADALQCRVDALAVLNTTRHELRGRSARLAWWKTYSTSLHKAAFEAWRGKDWTLLAELIEAARLQADPRERSTGTVSAPFVRVGGVSRIEDAFWQRPGADVPAYDLEDIAFRVLSTEAAWWSTWRSGDHVYWTLQRPGHLTTGGRHPFADVSTALAALRDALPVAFPGEDEEQFAVRTFESPLSSSIVEEGELARRLGTLIPPPVRAILLDSSRVTDLILAPTIEYANVPWASLAVSEDTRLVEVARVVIAGPVALSAKIASRDRGRSSRSNEHATSTPMAVTPVGGALLDPTSDLESSRAVISSLPASTPVITGDDAPTTSDIAELLRSVPREQAFLFAGHATEDRGPDGAIALRIGPDEVISTSDLTGDFDRLEFPETVVLLACTSGDLQSHTAGEWSGFAAAMLWAGVDRVIATAYPVPSSSISDTELVSRMASSPPTDALRAAQLAQLQLWRATRGGLGAPMEWAGHFAMGVFANPTPLESDVNGLRRRWIAQSLFVFLDRAAAAAARHRRLIVEPEDLWNVAYGWGWEFLPSIRRYWMAGGAFLASLPLRSSEEIEQFNSGIDLGVRTLTILDEAAVVARELHHRVIDVEHLIAALLRQPGNRASVARALSGRDTRQPEQLAFDAENTSPGWVRTGLPSLKLLSDSAAQQLLHRLRVPHEREEWYFSDRA